MKAHVHITLKSGVLDPQGKAVQNALGALGFDGVDSVRQGKYMEIDLAETDAAKAKTALKRAIRLDPANPTGSEPRPDAQQNYDSRNAKMLRNGLSEHTRGKCHDKGHNGWLHHALR